MAISEIKVKNQSTNYSIFIGSNIIKTLPKKIAVACPGAKKIALVVDKKIPKKFKNKLKKSLKKYEIHIFEYTVNEKLKSFLQVNKLAEKCLSLNFNRNDILIAFGGGIIGDFCGFTSSIIKRGVNFINLPSTLLSQVDSSLGGKTAVNSNLGKNLIGTFYQPKIVISDTDLLKSLPFREIVCGYAEILKHALISNKNLFVFLDKNFSKIINLKTPFIEKSIFESCKIKKTIVEKDEKEKSLRKILNFGHTFAHAYEASLRFSKKLNHGEAVLLGTNTALEFSNQKKILNNKDYELIINHFKKYKLPSNIKNYFSLKNLNKILLFMTKDKKNNSDEINLILLKKIGSPIINKRYKKSVISLFLKNQLGNKYLY